MVTETPLKEDSLDRILATHSELGSTLPPSNLRATLFYNPDKDSWYVWEGSILGAPVWSFGEDIDRILAQTPVKFTYGGRTFRKTSDVRTVDYGLQRIEVEYKLVSDRKPAADVYTRKAWFLRVWKGWNS